MDGSCTSCSAPADEGKETCVGCTPTEAAEEEMTPTEETPAAE